MNDFEATEEKHLIKKKKNVDYDTPTFLDVKRLIYIVIIIYKASKKSIN